MSQISRLRDAEISNGNLINADDIDTELNQLVSESNGQDTRLTNLESNAMTIGGVKSFSSAPKTDQIDERTSAAGVTIDSVLHKDGFIKAVPTTQPYVPAGAGEFGLDTTNNAYRGMIGSSTVSFDTFAGVNAQTGTTYTVLSTDRNKLVTFSNASAVAVTLPQAGNTGFGGLFKTTFANLGAGTVTITPTTSTMDGAAAITLAQNQSITVFSNDTNYFTARGRSLNPGWTLLATASASASTSVDFTSLIDSTYDEYMIIGNNIKPATASTILQMRVTEDGTNWKSGAADYAWSQSQIAFGNAGTTGSNGDTSIRVLGSATAALAMNNTDAAAGSFEIRLFSPSSTVRHKMFQIDGLYEPQGGIAQGMFRIAGSGTYMGTVNPIIGVRFLMSSGNITAGQFYLYGVRKS